MTPHPEWALEGCILGIEGGMEYVKTHTDYLLGLGLKISALWVQDWSGMNKGLLADTVRWNWELDENYYPNWKQ
jgi:sulfoquinovosidase